MIITTFDSTAARKAASFDRLNAEKPATGAGTAGNNTRGTTAAGAAPGAGADPGAKIAWAEVLAPRGTETRMGESVGQTLVDNRAAPVSGIVIVSDGGQNTGVDPQDALKAAIADKVPVPSIFTIGVGSTVEVKNVRVQDVAAPARTYPDDEFLVKAYLQSQGMAGRKVNVEMLWREAAAIADPKSTANLDKQTASVTLPEDGKPIAVEFKLKPDKVGRTSVKISLKDPPSDDHNKVDNELDADVEITERRNRVLLFASGASREYQFLRNQLQRILRSDGSKDKEFVVDVYLQTGSDGIAQDSSEILPSFPTTAAAMAEYDCVIAFDPDWRELSIQQLNLLREWVADKAGGMIVIAGRIYTDVTARDPNLSIIRSLYPVEFGRVFAVAGKTAERETPWPLRFTEEGKRSEFLRLDDDQSAGLDPWIDFEGFYDYYPVKGIKDKAVVLAGLADPNSRPNTTVTDDARPYLLVEHAVGAGRVLYMGSGELWRLRAVNPSYFTRLYTQLVRHAAQARLLRDSKRGVLMVDHDNGRYMLHDMVEVRAQLTDGKALPLKEREVPLLVSAPDKTTQTVKLQADSALPGNYRGLFPVRQMGTFRLDLIIPDSNQELLTRRLQVRKPNKESDDVRLNEVVLRRLAESTGGGYYAGVDAAMGLAAPATPVAAENPDSRPIVSRLADRTRITPRLAKPVSLWDNQWMLTAICSVLCLEWLVRRFAKLA